MRKYRKTFQRLALSSALAATIILTAPLHSPSDKLSATETPVESATVIIQGFQFKPSELTLKQGGSVTFINKDSTPHTATPTENATFTGTGRLRRNQEKTVIFDELGVQEYFCDIHPSMKGMVKVVI